MRKIKRPILRKRIDAKEQSTFAVKKRKRASNNGRLWKRWIAEHLPSQNMTLFYKILHKMTIQNREFSFKQHWNFVLKRRGSVWYDILVIL